LAYLRFMSRMLRQEQKRDKYEAILIYQGGFLKAIDFFRKFYFWRTIFFSETGSQMRLLVLQLLTKRNKTSIPLQQSTSMRLLQTRV
jgi:hypothetical protein